jgi:hypothetical protein
MSGASLDRALGPENSRCRRSGRIAPRFSAVVYLYLVVSADMQLPLPTPLWLPAPLVRSRDATGGGQHQG